MGLVGGTGSAFRGSDGLKLVGRNQNRASFPNPGRVRQRGGAVPCGTTPPPTLPFKSCSQCRAVRYCTPDCQTAYWSAHKPSCAPRGGFTITRPPKRKTFHSFVHSQSAGLDTILFDHVFGCVYSLVQAVGFQREGPGVLLCELSCAVEDFCARKDPTLLMHRRIRSTYVPAVGYAALNRLRAENEPPVAELAVMVDEMECAFPGQLLVMFVVAPCRKCQAFLMMSWVKVEEGAFPAPPRWLADFDWESCGPPPIIDAAFYREKMATNDARRARGNSFLDPDDNKLVPPLGFQRSLGKGIEDLGQVAGWARGIGNHLKGIGGGGGQRGKTDGGAGKQVRREWRRTEAF
ncbi:hypothetical protein BDK51DRAFT_31111 [Blyttiomyces helicus]|uniref:MYND-type domain-containing protein n=1 Tax=Blyttiomyces helicus TaxID=388810 RepID=A0A4P9WHA9_9FUNG|nr:hypothetical protein BDK51DRAFT_31111 [Blyttiomyces helicus]|eukprot:RKO91233.1 hypothetical protein BDK51DRAFT_31111 [Blyttiomyces helicus]